MASLAAMTHGSALVLPSESFDAPAALAAIAAERCTALYGVPTMFIAMLEAWRARGADPAQVASLRNGIMGAARVGAGRGAGLLGWGESVLSIGPAAEFVIAFMGRCAVQRARRALSA